MAFRDGLNRLKEQNPEFFQGAGPWFCLPLRLIGVLTPRVRDPGPQSFTVEEADFESTFTRPNSSMSFLLRIDERLEMPFQRG